MTAASVWQVELQPSPFIVLPSSHCSAGEAPVSVNPSPQLEATQVIARQMSRVAGFMSALQAVPSAGAARI
jgi:hypothetical protein